jgi:hypothetical protein
VIEIPESDVSKHTLTGDFTQRWHISKGPRLIVAPPIDSIGHDRPLTANPSGQKTGLTNGEPNPRFHRPSKSYTQPRSRHRPTLTGKKEYTDKNGVNKTEHFWRHPPVYETTTGQTQPLYVGAGIGDLSSPGYDNEEEEIDEESEFKAMRPDRYEADLLFRDSGYGFGGMLPGLREAEPIAKRRGGRQRSSTIAADGSDVIGGLTTRGNGSDDETIRAFQRLQLESKIPVHS